MTTPRHQTSNPSGMSLVQSLQQKLEIFRSADQLATVALQEMQKGSLAQEVLDQIDQRLQSAADVDQRLNSGKLPAEPAPVHPQLPSLKKDLQQTLEQLIDKTTQLEARVQSAKEKLQPQINHQVTASRMHRAYQSGS